MSETSRSRVTVTLGRTGQVVKRDGSGLDSSHPVSGRKRSILERLGNNVDSTAEINNKRLHGDGRTSHAVDDLQLRTGDLRYKIMQKNSLKKSQNSVDLRNLLSRPAQSSTNSVTTRAHRMPDSNGTRPYSEQTETRDGRHLLPMNRSSIQHMHHSSDPRKHHVFESRESGISFLQEKEVRLRGPEPRMEPAINAYSPWTLESLRKRSPDESLTTSRGGNVVVAPKRDEILKRRLPVGTYDAARTRAYDINKEGLDISSPMISSSQLTRTAPRDGQRMNFSPMTAPLPLPGSLMQRSSYMVDDQVSVDSLLRSLGLEKYAILFKAEEVDMYSLKRMSERDLKELGIPMGPRKKILLSLQPRLKQQA